MDKLIGEEILDSNGEKVDNSVILQNEILMLYFGASWAPPCSEFEHTLAEFYSQLKQQNKKCEIIFISCDNTLEEYNVHINDIPFYRLPFDQNKISNLEDILQISYLPMLVLMNHQGNIAKQDVRPLILNPPPDIYAQLKQLSLQQPQQ